MSLWERFQLLEEEVVRHSLDTGGPFRISGLHAMASRVPYKVLEENGWAQSLNSDHFDPDRDACERLQRISRRMQLHDGKDLNGK